MPNLPHHAQFHLNRPNHCWDMAIFPFARWRPPTILYFLKVQHFECLYGSVEECVTVPYFVPIGQTVVNMWPSFDISRWRPSAYWFLKDVNFNCRYGSEGQYAPPWPCQISCQSIQIVAAISRFFKTAAVRHVGFAILLLGPPVKSILGNLYHFAKFGWNLCGSFDNVGVLIFCVFGWKRLFKPSN